MCNMMQTWLVQSWMQEFSQQLWFLMFNFCEQSCHHYSVNQISTNLTNITLRKKWLTSYLWFVTQVREWLISKSFFMIKSTIFDIRTGEHTYFASSSIRWSFHFSQKRWAHADLILKGFLHCQLLGGEWGVQRYRNGIHRLELAWCYSPCARAIHRAHAR